MTTQQIDGYRAGSLSLEEELLLEEHLASCDGCRRAICLSVSHAATSLAKRFEEEEVVPAAAPLLIPPANGEEYTALPATQQTPKRNRWWSSVLTYRILSPAFGCVLLLLIYTVLETKYEREKTSLQTHLAQVKVEQTGYRKQIEDARQQADMAQKSAEKSGEQLGKAKRQFDNDKKQMTALLRDTALMHKKDMALIAAQNARLRNQSPNWRPSPEISAWLRPESTGQLASDTETTRPALALTPTNTLLTTDRPPFRWLALGKALDYKVVIWDDSVRKVLQTSEPITGTEWTPPVALPYGHKFQWWLDIRMTTGGKEGSKQSLRQKFALMEADAAGKLLLHIGDECRQAYALEDAERKYDSVPRASSSYTQARKRLEEIRTLRRGKESGQGK